MKHYPSKDELRERVRFLEAEIERLRNRPQSAAELAASLLQTASVLINAADLLTDKWVSDHTAGAGKMMTE